MVCYSIICLKLWHESKSQSWKFTFIAFIIQILSFHGVHFVVWHRDAFTFDAGEVSSSLFNSEIHHLLWQLSFFHWVFLASLSLDFKYMQMVVSEHSLLFPWCINPCLCQYYTIWIVLWYGWNFKKGGLHLASLYLLKSIFAVCGPLEILYDFWQVFSISVNISIVSLIMNSLNLWSTLSNLEI